MITIERWARIPDFPDYEASTHGRIRSLRRKRPEPLVLTPILNENGYLQVGLYREPGKRVARRVHQLVAVTFVGPPPLLPEGARGRIEVCHNDGVRLNNRPENLRYDTSRGNIRDAIEQGSHPCVAASAKDECVHGHAYTPENTCYLPPSAPGRSRRRYCRTCKNEQRRARYAAA